MFAVNIFIKCYALHPEAETHYQLVKIVLGLNYSVLFETSFVIYEIFSCTSYILIVSKLLQIVCWPNYNPFKFNGFVPFVIAVLVFPLVYVRKITKMRYFS